MKTTIDLPEELTKRAKIAAARRHTTFKNQVIEGLEEVLRKEAPEVVVDGALQRLQKGLHLSGQPPTREEIHARYVFYVHPALWLRAGIEERFQLSLWDAMIVAAAKTSGARILLTEDLNHGQDYDGGIATNPFI